MSDYDRWLTRTPEDEVELDHDGEPVDVTERELGRADHDYERDRDDALTDD